MGCCGSAKCWDLVLQCGDPYSYVCCFTNPFDNIHDISSINLPAIQRPLSAVMVQMHLYMGFTNSLQSFHPIFWGHRGSPFQGPDVGPIFQQRWIPPPPPAAPRLPSGFVPNHGSVAPPIPSSSSAPVVTGGFGFGPWENADEALASYGFSRIF